MRQQSNLPPRVEQAPLTPLAELFVELDALVFQCSPSRRFWVRPVLDGEFDTVPVVGDENGLPVDANAMVLDRTRPRLRFVYCAACDADMRRPFVGAAST